MLSAYDSAFQQKTVRDVSTSLDMTRSPVGMTEKLFASLSVYHDLDSHSAALNMAIDEALLERATAPTIRFYRWDHRALSFGYFGKFTDVATYKRDTVRRWTGGGLVLHGEDLTYSIVIPASDSAFAESSVSIYEKTHGAIRDALNANGESAFVCCSHAPPARPTQDMAANNSPEGRGYNKDACFANPVRADVMLDNKKIAGAAQRRTRRGLLQQGSIQQLELDENFEMRFATALSAQPMVRNVDASILNRAREIARQKYATDAWLRHR